MILIFNEMFTRDSTPTRCFKKKKFLKDVDNENDLIMKLAVLFVSHLIASDISRVDNEDVQL